MQYIIDPLRMCKYILLLFVNINKKTSWSLLWIGFNCIKAIESLQGYRFFLSTRFKSPRFSDTQIKERQSQF